MSTVMEDLGRSLDDVITHRICIITESDWFKDLVQSEVTAYLNAKPEYTVMPQEDES
jgi:hypothetical protein